MDKQIREFSKKNNRKRMLKRVVSLLCVVVLLFTVNTLKRSANTLERIPMCGLIEHIHGSECYNGAGELACGMAEHVHTDACYQQSPTGGGTMDNLDINIDGYDSRGDQSDADGAQSLDLSLDLSQGDLLDFVQDPKNNQAPANNDLKVGDMGLIEDPAPVVANNASSDGQEVVVEFEDGIQSNAQQNADTIGQENEKPVETEQEQPADIEDIKEETENTAETEKAPAKSAETEEAIEAPAKTEMEEAQEQPAETETEEAQEQPAETETEEEETEAPATTEEDQEQIDETEEAAVEPAETETEETQEQPAETETEEAQEQPAETETEEAQEQPAETENKEEETEAPATTEESQEQADEIEEAAVEPAETETEETQEQPTETEVEDGQVKPVETEEGETEAPAEAETEIEQVKPVETEEDETEAPAEAETEIEQVKPVETEEGETEAPAATEEEQEQADETEEEAVEPAEAETKIEEGQEQPSETETEGEAEQSAETEEGKTEAPAVTEEEQEQADETKEEAVEPAETETETEEGQEQPAETATEDEQEQSTDDEDEGEQSAETEEGEPEETAAEEEQEQDDAETQAAERRYTATVDFTEVESYPISLRGVIANATPAEDYEDAPEATEEKPLDEWDIELDSGLFEIETTEDDVLLTPVADFESTEIFISNGSRYELTLVNCTLEQPEEAPQTEPEAQVARPAKHFEESTTYMNVVVDAPEGAFPEGTVMVVKDVEDEGTLRNIEQSVAGDFVEVTSVHAVDISFWYNDAEIEPLLPIAVVMSAVEADEKSEAPVVVHVTDDGETSVVNSESISATEAALEMPATENPEAQAFEADSFSVYAIVGTQTLVKNYIDDSGKTWSIKVGYTEEAGLPEGARLEVAEIEDSESYLAEAEAALDEGKRITKARFFDIRIVDADGNAVQPKEAVQVTATMLGDEGKVEAGEGQTDVGSPEVLAMHFVERNDEIVKVVSKNADESGDSVTFTAEGFSPWGVVYTVDFTYVDEEGNEHFWQFPGTGSHKISEVLAELDIEAEAITAVDLVRTETVGEYGEKDLYLSQDAESGEWYINSDAAFDDTYLLTVTADEKVYEITVTDNQLIEKSHRVVLNIGNGVTLPSNMVIVGEFTYSTTQWNKTVIATAKTFAPAVEGTVDYDLDHSVIIYDDNGTVEENPTLVDIYLAVPNQGETYYDYMIGQNTEDQKYTNGEDISGATIVVSTNNNLNVTTITIGNVGPVDYTASINFYDAWSEDPDSSVDLESPIILKATTAESDVYTATITGNADPIAFTNDGSETTAINTAETITWSLNGTELTQESSVTIDGYVVSAPTKSGTNYTFEARKPNTYTASLTFKGDSGVAETPSSLGDNYYLVVNDAIYAPVTTSGLGTWVGVTDNKLPEITSFKFVQATGPVSSVSDLTGLTVLDKISDYDIVTSTVPTPDGSHNYAFEVAKPIICTASITVDGASDLTDGVYYIVATKDSADVGYYKIGETAENIAFTAFAGGTVSLDTETTFRVVKLAAGAAANAEAFAAATDVAAYSGAKIGENRYTWALDEGTHNYAFSVAPDALPADTLRQVVVNLYCHDGTTRVDDTAATADAQEGLKDTGKKMVIVARLEDKSKTNDDPERVIGFQAVGKAFDGHGSYDGIYFKNTFTGLAYNESWQGYDRAEAVMYDSAKHDISIRMYVVDNSFYIGETVDNSVYNNVCSQEQAPEGYAFKSAPNGNVTSGTTTTLNLQKTLPTKYQVKVLFDEAIAMPESAKIFLYVQAQHATSGTDKFAGLVTSATPVTELTYVLYDPSQNPASGWTKNNGGKFTGNENVQYGLYFLKQGTTLNVDQLNETTVSEIAEGGYVYGNTVSYTKQRTIEEIDNQTVITDYVVLTRIPTDSDYNFRSVLGNGLYFGITANQLTQNNDLQTNFACNTFNHVDHSVTPNLSGASSGTFYIGEVTNSSVQINSAGNNTTCTIYVGEASKDQITPGSNVIVVPTTKANIANIVNPILAHGKAVSDDMAAHAPTMNIVVPANANEFVLDTRMFPEDATIYIDGDYLATTRILGITDGLKIWKHENQVIVFNFKTTQSVKSSQYVINGVASSTQTSQGAADGANAGSDILARGIVWNMNTEGGSFDAGTMLGIVLAPNNGNVDIAKEGSGSSGAGWIIANTVKNWGGEWHNIYADMPAVNKAIINAKKTVNNRNAKGREKFLFKLERYNTGKQWEVVEASKENHGSAIEFANVGVNDYEHDCWTIYKITETAVVPTIDRAEAYTITNKVYYAAVYSDYVVDQQKGTRGNVIYPTQYYESFSEAAYAETIGAPDYVPTKDSVPGVSNLVSDDVPVFNNLYNTEDEDGLVATKMMEGRSLTEGDVFTFTLTGTATTKTDKIISVSQIKTNDVTGKVRFDELKFALNATQDQINSGYYELDVRDFDENNEFIMTLTMAEDTSKLPESVQAMTAAKTLTVTVKRTLLDDPNANEELDVTISPKNSELVFTNKYDATGTAVISAKKAENSVLGDRKFQFQLLKEDGTTVIETSAPVAQGQTATFKELSYELSDLGGETYKDFTYKVKEVIPDGAVDVEGGKKKDGVTYDTTVHTVVVRMTDNGEGQLTPSYKVDGETEFSATLSTPTFSNTYSATGSVGFKATKIFDHGTLTANQFTFKLIQVTADGSDTPVAEPIADAQTVYNAQDGSVNFDNIPFTLEHTNGGTGTYYFLLKEEVPQDVDANNIKEGIKYDTSKIWVKVEVTDAGDGSLTVTKYKKNGSAWEIVTDDTLPDATFTNEQLISVGVRKIWKDEGGTQFRPSGVSVTLEMKRHSRNVGSTEWSGNADETHTVVITINETGTGWTRTVDGVAESEKLFSSTPGGAGYADEYDAAMSYTWQNLPKTNAEGTMQYGYRVTEKEFTYGYHQANTDSSAHFTESGVQYITNVKFSVVSLPATGGMGTGVVYGAGAALILLAVLGLVLMNRKRSRGTGI